MKKNHKFATDILIIHHYGRTNQRLRQEIRTLFKNGKSVGVLLWKRNREFDSRIECSKYIDVFNFSIPKGIFWLVLVLPLSYIGLLAKSLKYECDVVHVTHLMLLPLAIMLKITKRAKIVYDVHEFYLMGLEGKLPSWFKPVFKKLKSLEFLLVKNVNGILAIDSRENILETSYLRYNDNVKVLYNVPDLEYKPDSRYAAYLKEKYTNKKVVLYIGGISIEKGALKTLESIEIAKQTFPNILCVFIGPFLNSRTQNEFCRFVNSHNLGEVVKVLGWLTYEKMLAYLTIGEVGLALHQPLERFYLLSKGNGRKFFTYMNYGLPVISCDYGEIGKIIHEEKAGIFTNSMDCHDISDKICELLSDGNKRNELGRNGRQAVIRRYNWSIEEAKLLEVYNNL